MKRAWAFLALAIVFNVLMFSIVFARDLGQWENTDPEIKEWFQKLMQPDNPGTSCCGEADAYWAGDLYLRDGKMYALIEDDRDDKPLKRPHVENGTEVEVPGFKLKKNQGNPTGHNVAFLAGAYHYVLCFVQSARI